MFRGRVLLLLAGPADRDEDHADAAPAWCLFIPFSYFIDGFFFSLPRPASRRANGGSDRKQQRKLDPKPGSRYHIDQLPLGPMGTN